MTFLEQISYVLRKVEKMIATCLITIRRQKAFAFLAILLVIGVTVWMIVYFGSSVQDHFGPLLGLAAGLILNFSYSVYNQIQDAKNKKASLEDTRSDLEAWKDRSDDPDIKSMVNSSFQKLLE
jgi:hypothetical protein